MKKLNKTILVITVLCTTFVLNAQSWSDDLQFGVRGGLNFSTVVGDDVDEPDT